MIATQQADVRRRLRRLSVPLAAAALLAACGDDGGEGMTPPSPMDNRAPTARIMASPITVPPGDDHRTVVTLDGSDSSDPDGDPLTFFWTVPSGRFVAGTTASDTVAQVTFPGLAPYTVTLRVDDGRGGTDTGNVTIGLSN